MGVVCGEVFAWDGRILAKIVSLLLGRGIEIGRASCRERV